MINREGGQSKWWSIGTVVNRNDGQSGRWSIGTVINRDGGQSGRWSIGTVVNIIVVNRDGGQSEHGQYQRSQSQRGQLQRGQSGLWSILTWPNGTLPLWNRMSLEPEDLAMKRVSSFMGLMLNTRLGLTV